MREGEGRSGVAEAQNWVSWREAYVHQDKAVWSTLTRTTFCLLVFCQPVGRRWVVADLTGGALMHDILSQTGRMTHVRLAGTRIEV